MRRKWTTRDLKILRESAAAGETMYQVAPKLNRTPDSVRFGAQRYDVTFAPHNGSRQTGQRGPDQGRRMDWKDGKADQVLRDGARDGLTSFQVAALLGCNRAAVLSRAHKTGVIFTPSRANDGRKSNGPRYTGWRPKGEEVRA